MIKSKNESFNYQIKNWDKYGLNLKGEKDMLKLLNILEVYDETLDSFHDVALNGYDEFCGIICFASWKSDNDLLSTLMDYNIFYDSIEIYIKEVALDNAKYNNETLEEYLEYMDIRESSDGIVLVINC